MTREEEIRARLQKATPGPWEVVSAPKERVLYVTCADGWAVAKVHNHQDGSLDDNAALIASAPDLLKENQRLRETLRWIEQVAFERKVILAARQALQPNETTTRQQEG